MHCLIKSSIDYYFKRKFHDKDAKIYVAAGNTTGIPFASFYDVKKLKERILDTIEKSDLKYSIYVLKNGKDIHPNIYCRFILEIIK